MKDLTTTIEQSNRLLEMGVPANKASMVWQSEYTPDRTPELYATPYQDKNGYPPIEKIRADVVPAFTISDLLKIIPEKLHIEGCDRQFELAKWAGGYAAKYRAWPDSNIKAGVGTTPIDALYEAVCWLISNRYVKGNQ